MLLYHVGTNYGDAWRNRVGYMIMFFLFIGYTLVFVLFGGGEIEGCSMENNLTVDCNFVGYVDRIVITRAHIWRHRSTDPEGLISSIGALFTTFMGYNYSLVMSTHKGNPKHLIIRWLAISLICGGLVYPSTLWLPFNKQLYTTTFILIVVAVSGASLTFFYLVVDLLPTWKPQFKRPI